MGIGARDRLGRWAAGLLLGTFAPGALGQSIKLAATLDLETDGYFRMLHATSYVLVNQQVRFGEGRDRTPRELVGVVVDLALKTSTEVKVSLGPLYRQLSHLFVDMNPTWTNQKGEVHASFEAHLIHYDPARRHLGVLVRNHYRDRFEGWWHNREIYLAMDPTGKILWTRLLDEERGEAEARFDHLFGSVGPSSSGRHHFFYSSRKLAVNKGKTAARVRLLRVDIEAGRLDWSYVFDTPPTLDERLHGRLRVTASPDDAAIVVAEYSEQGARGRKAKLHVVEVGKQAHQSLSAPYTPYGVAFDLANRLLVVGSNQSAILVQYDLSSGKKVAQLATLGHLHRLTRSSDGKFLYVLANGGRVEVRAWPSLEVAAELKVEEVLPGVTALAPERATASLDGRFLVTPPADHLGLGADRGVQIVELR
jgi:hypothetical protein